MLYLSLTMASSNELTNSLEALNLNCHLSNHLDVMTDIKCNYESIFSWNIYEKIEKRRNHLTDILEKITQKQDLIIEKKDTFNFNK